jgi:hypothetical protein
MVKRVRKRSASRRSASGHGREPRAAQEGGGGANDEAPGLGARILEGVTQALHHAVLFGKHHPLGRLSLAFVVHTLEWQSMLLEVYQRVLREGAFDAPTEEQLRKMARSMMSAYLELAKSAPERRERLLAGQAELAQALAEAIEDMRQRLATPTG